MTGRASSSHEMMISRLLWEQIEMKNILFPKEKKGIKSVIRFLSQGWRQTD